MVKREVAVISVILAIMITGLAAMVVGGVQLNSFNLIKASRDCEVQCLEGGYKFQFNRNSGCTCRSGGH